MIKLKDEDYKIIFPSIGKYKGFQINLKPFIISMFESSKNKKSLLEKLDRLEEVLDIDKE